MKNLRINTLWDRFIKEVIVQKIWLLFILFLTASFTGNGQNTSSGPFLSPVGEGELMLQPDEMDKFLNFKEKISKYNSVTLVHTADISKYQKNKRITFYLPGTKGNPIAKARKIEAYSLERPNNHKKSYYTMNGWINSINNLYDLFHL